MKRLSITLYDEEEEMLENAVENGNFEKEVHAIRYAIRSTFKQGVPA